jgi:methylated-DNA-[protein]-cysteine S-methyltransferase
MVRASLKFAVSESPLGALGVAWSEAGIVGSWMHEGSVERTRARITHAYPNAAEANPPAAVAQAIRAAQALLSGEPCDLRAAPLDMTAISDFDRRVYDIVRTIPAGQTMTYGAVAAAMGEEPMAARDVGVAMARNRFAPFVPCHRVVAANGKLGGYSAPGGSATKRRLLEIEGVQFEPVAAQQVGLFDQI